ncbi:MAG: CPBP family intramembrane metalloprotease, partial [Flavobacteriaceae bacterium]|nr:CPBP family intramembrane metalloprotease [Flavobacteriaceae bacterium]
TLVTIEHALYGNWLFTVGMGQMLAFPGMES